MRSTVEAGEASPDNARRTVPVAVTSSRHLARPARARRPGRGAGGRGSGIRRGPQAAGHRGAVRGSRRVRRACVRRTRRKLPPQLRRVPRVNPGRLRRVILAALSLSTARVRPRCSRPGPSGPARRRCALDDCEENPHNHQYVGCRIGRGSVRCGYSGQSNLAQIVRLVWSPSTPHSSATARTMSSPWCRVGSIIPWFQGPPSSWTSIRT
jgi:hypothetical protein